MRRNNLFESPLWLNSNMRLQVAHGPRLILVTWQWQPLMDKIRGSKWSPFCSSKFEWTSIIGRSLLIVFVFGRNLIVDVVTAVFKFYLFIYFCQIRSLDKEVVLPKWGPGIPCQHWDTKVPCHWAISGLAVVVILFLLKQVIVSNENKMCEDQNKMLEQKRKAKTNYWWIGGKVPLGPALKLKYVSLLVPLHLI